MQHFPLENFTDFQLCPVTLSDLAETAALCDAYVGKNLYTQSKIRNAIENEDHFFYLLRTLTGKLAGYIYFLLTDIPSVARDAKITPELLESACGGPQGRVCKLQSVALREEYRGSGLAAQMVKFALKQVQYKKISAIFSICWKMGQVVPLEKALQDCGFSFLTEAENVWYDEDALFCPYCKGRCHCNAEIYFKKLV